MATAVNPASAHIDSSTRFRVLTWRGIQAPGRWLNQGDEFPRGTHSHAELVALMTMGRIEPMAESITQPEAIHGKPVIDRTEPAPRRRGRPPKR